MPGDHDIDDRPGGPDPSLCPTVQSAGEIDYTIAAGIIGYVLGLIVGLFAAPWTTSTIDAWFLVSASCSLMTVVSVSVVGGAGYIKVRIDRHRRITDPPGDNIKATATPTPKPPTPTPAAGRGRPSEGGGRWRGEMR